MVPELSNGVMVAAVISFTAGGAVMGYLLGRKSVSVQALAVEINELNELAAEAHCIAKESNDLLERGNRLATTALHHMGINL